MDLTSEAFRTYIIEELIFVSIIFLPSTKKLTNDGLIFVQMIGEFL